MRLSLEIGNAADHSGYIHDLVHCAYMAAHILAEEERAALQALLSETKDSLVSLKTHLDGLHEQLTHSDKQPGGRHQ